MTSTMGLTKTVLLWGLPKLTIHQFETKRILLFICQKGLYLQSTYNQYKQSFEAHNVCVIIPTYNNAGTLEALLRSVLEYTDRVIVVNDGSTDGTTEVLAGFPGIDVIAYTVNEGKGKALRKGFVYATDHGYDYAITIDSDGQHFAADLPLFLKKLDAEKGLLVIGSRNLHQENMPAKNTFANKFSNFWFYVDTGIKAPDTQSGYRLYPLYLMRGMRFYGRKYEFEVEVLVRAAWKGIKIDWIPVNIYYPPAEERVSHLKKSLSVGFGVFMGIVPIWGFQMAVALVLAAIFRLNKALTIIASNISIPPMIPLIVFLSYLLGRFWVGKNAVYMMFSRHITLEAWKLNIEQYIYGSVTLAVIAGLVAWGVTYGILEGTSPRPSPKERVRSK